MAPRSARQLAAATLREWRRSSGFADAILNRHLVGSDLTARDRGFATELTYGVFRHLSQLDFWIERLRQESLGPDTRDLLRLGVYQLLLLELPPHAAVFETVALAPPRSRGLVNAVLRNAVRRKEELLQALREQKFAVRTSHPEFLVDRWCSHFGQDNTAALCEWNNSPAPIYARVNLLQTSVADFRKRVPDSKPTAADDTMLEIEGLPCEALAGGECYIQDPSTLAACQLLDPKPGEQVLDACAAPGGKTAYLAQLMRNQGQLTACDRDPGRLTTLRQNLERLGVQIARVLEHDWLTGSPRIWSAADPIFDRILLDAPCTNTGVMRRRVDLRWRLKPEDFTRMQARQLQILRTITPFLKVGGTLVYSTCSIDPQENEQVARLAAEELPFFKSNGAVDLLPFRDGVDGAFAIKLQRRA